MNELTNEQTNERTNERTNKLTNERTNKRMNDRLYILPVKLEGQAQVCNLRQSLTFRSYGANSQVKDQSDYFTSCGVINFGVF